MKNEYRAAALTLLASRHRGEKKGDAPGGRRMNAGGRK